MERNLRLFSKPNLKPAACVHCVQRFSQPARSTLATRNMSCLIRPAGSRMLFQQTVITPLHSLPKTHLVRQQTPNLVADAAGLQDLVLHTRAVGKRASLERR
jgi:hypothetical protein